ncbi:CDP-alcohol phosphatidyltransferase family protein [Pedobacter frigidisoli]|uniref:CDP-alcohol phosphatidyltransferase family protein n=1 Tax=Pedobacter frigidisoli TaxID=2530455 RepID=UPI00292E240C|nr:CDP-alcohol phosphatidyltransferase family protein [Pedobacter frigidisoli]
MAVTTKEQITERKQIFADRKRSNLMRNGEQSLIHFLLKHIPEWVSPNILTGIGMLGSFIVFGGFTLAEHYHKNFLLLGIVGLIVNWLGDSLDGRLAYYRNIPRKWYGFALDIIMDWMSIILTGLGYYFYANESVKVLGFLFVVLYGWSMIISLLRYKITDVYRIDSGWFGPTELRVLIALIFIVEWLFPQTITYSAVITTASLFIINTIDTYKLLEAGNERDREEKLK